MSDIQGEAKYCARQWLTEEGDTASHSICVATQWLCLRSEVVSRGKRAHQRADVLELREPSAEDQYPSRSRRDANA